MMRPTEGPIDVLVVSLLIYPYFLVTKKDVKYLEPTLCLLYYIKSQVFDWEESGSIIDEYLIKKYHLFFDP